jgi:uncharacterized protein YjbI with pentapeptide repeats
MGERSVPVRSYERGDGTAVSGHTRHLQAPNPAVTPVDTAALRSGLESIAEPFRDIDGVQVPLLGTTPVGSPPDFSGWRLCGVDLSGLDLRGANFANCALVDVTFAGSDLRDATFRDGTLDGVDLTGATVTGMSLRSVSAVRLTADELDVTDVDMALAAVAFTREKPRPVIRNLNAASIGHSTLQRMDVSGQDLSRLGTRQPSGPSDWTDVDFSGSNLTGADFGSSVINGCDFSRVTAPDVTFALGSIEASSLLGADFSGGDFSLCNISNANFTGANLTGTKFSIFSVSSSGFGKANFSHADMSDPNERNGPAFEACDFRGANFTQANLGKSDFASAYGYWDGDESRPVSDLRGCTWTGANTKDMTVSCDNGRTFIDENGYDVDVDDWLVADYERFSVNDATAALGVDADTLAVLAWGGVVEVRDNVTGQVVDDVADLTRCHVPIWAIQNYM